MYICRWFVLCETVVVDRSSNNLTMVNALTELQAFSFPALHPRFAFASLLEKQGESEGPLSLRFVREMESGDEVLLKSENNIEKPPRVQFCVNFMPGIRLLNVGTVTFRVEVREGDADWYTAGSQSIQVSLATQQKDASSNENESANHK